MEVEAATKLFEYGIAGIFIFILVTYIYFLNKQQKAIQDRHHTERTNWMEKSDKQFVTIADLTKETNVAYTANASAVSELRGVMAAIQAGLVK